MKAKVIPTNWAIWQRTQRGRGNCFIYGIEKETFFHTCYECSNAKALAFGSQWGIKFEEWGFTTFEQIISFIINPPMNLIPPSFSKENLVVLLISLFYMIWNRRNQSKFNSQPFFCHAINRMVKEY